MHQSETCALCESPLSGKHVVTIVARHAIPFCDENCRQAADALWNERHEPTDQEADEMAEEHKALIAEVEQDLAAIEAEAEAEEIEQDWNAYQEEDW